MAFCKKCGETIDDNAVICPKCGVAQQQLGNQNDTGGFGYTLLGCCLPIVGLILYLVWKNDKPNSAKSSLKGFIIGMILSVLFGIGYSMLIVMGISNGMSMYY